MLAKRVLGLARESLGLNCADPAKRLPMRVEAIWRAEWRASGLAPNVPFQVTSTISIAGQIDLGALQGCILDIARRHEGLRSGIEVRDGRLFQLVRPEKCIPFETVNLGGLDLGQALVENSKSIINLLEGPAYRFKVLRNEGSSGVLCVTAHHYFCDAWSFRRLFAEINFSLRNQLQRRDDDFPMQYSEYSFQQRSRLSEHLADHLEFWRDKLINFPPTVLPYDGKLPSEHMREATFMLPCLWGNIHYQAQKLKTTSFVLGLAAYKLALSKWAGSSLTVSAVTMADRGGLAKQQVVGYLVNELPIPTVISKSTKITDLIYRLHDLINESLMHQDLSYELYDEIFSPPGPFCTTLLNVIGRAKAAPEVFSGKWDGEPLVSFGGVSKRKYNHREVYFELIESEGQVEGRLLYNDGLFSEQTICKLIYCFCNGVEAVLRTDRY